MQKNGGGLSKSGQALLTKKIELFLHFTIFYLITSIPARMADSDEASKDTEAKAAYEMIKDKMNALKGLNIANSDVKRLKQNVSGYLRTW